MLSTPEFKKFASNVVLFLHNTSHVEGDPYPNLLSEKGGNGHPTVSFLAHDGRMLHQLPFGPTVAQMEEKFAALTEWEILKKKAANSEDQKLAARVFKMEMDFGMLSHAEAEEGFDKLKGQFTDAEVAKLKPIMVELEFQSHFRKINLRDQSTMVKAGQHFVAMIEGDRIPRSQQVITFWQSALTYAGYRKDPDLFEKIMLRGQKEMAGDRRAERYMGRVRRQLEQLRKNAKKK